ncbi:MAG TPA: hypothetical protein VGM27_22410 [Acidobacteriaceae bacterium]
MKKTLTLPFLLALALGHVAGQTYLTGRLQGDPSLHESQVSATGRAARLTLNAAEYPGDDCGAKISAALSALHGPGKVSVPVSCGIIRTQVSLGTNQHLELLAGTYPVSAMITIGQQASIECPPTADSPGAGYGSCLIQATAGSNLPVVLLLNGTNAVLSNVTVDGQQFSAIQWAGLAAGGGGYTAKPDCFVTGDGLGAQCSVDLDPASKTITTVTLTDYGRGYTHAVVNLTGGGGRGASVVAAVGPHLNPSAGANIKIMGVRSRLDHVTSIHAAAHGIQIGDTTTDNAAAASKLDHVMSLFNSGDGIYGVNTTDVHLGGQSEIENNLGAGVDLINCGAWRIVANDIGGNGTNGINVTGTIDTALTHHSNSFGQIIIGNQFGNNVAHDIQIEGYDHKNGGYVSLYNTISENQFIGSQLRPTNTYDAIHIEDSGGNSLTANTVWQGPPNAYRNGIGIYESTDGREFADIVASNLTKGPTTPIRIVKSTMLGANSENGGGDVRETPAFWLNDKPWGAMDVTGTGTPLGILDQQNRVLYFGHSGQKQIDLQPNPGTSLLQLDGNRKQVTVLGTLVVSSLHVEGKTVGADLRGITDLMGGSRLGVGVCVKQQLKMPGAQTSMAAQVSPVDGIDPGDGFYLRGYVSSENFVTVKVCAAVGGVPRATRYVVHVRE